MRNAYLIVGGVLLLALALVTSGHTLFLPVEMGLPGQYPLDGPRPEWPSTESVGLYRPTAGMGSNLISGSLNRDAKFRCGVESGCALPLSTV
jgi:hypothetical protein